MKDPCIKILVISGICATGKLQIWVLLISTTFSAVFCEIIISRSVDPLASSDYKKISGLKSSDLIFDSSTTNKRSCLNPIVLI